MTNLEGVIEEIRSICGTGMELGLERVRRLLARLGNPEAETRFVHVGGTNGKGSVTVMIEAVLQDAGYKTGSFISPHLHSYTERYRVNGEAIADDELAFLLEGLLPDLKALAREGAAPTEFEALTAAAFLCFVRNKADLAVMEVGLGGRLDATNVIVPEVAVITNVSLDHTEILGHTLREVAGEKAGIIKRGVPVVTGAEGEALEVIARRCRELDAPLVVVGRDVTWSEQPAAGAPPFLVVCGRRQRYR
ncbi:bifunctional folylpolyglutamate synthase/dihydrofolate synthase, partial [Desulforudis sp. 1190]